MVRHVSLDRSHLLCTIPDEGEAGAKPEGQGDGMEADCGDRKGSGAFLGGVGGWASLFVVLPHHPLTASVKREKN